MARMKRCTSASLRETARTFYGEIAILRVGRLEDDAGMRGGDHGAELVIG